MKPHQWAHTDCCSASKAGWASEATRLQRPILIEGLQAGVEHEEKAGMAKGWAMLGERMSRLSV